MNTQLNIKTLRLRLNPIVPLLVGVVVLVLSSPSALAQADAGATTTTAPASASVVDSSITLSVSGTVNDPNGTITFSGSVLVNCRRVIDTTGVSPPLVVLDFDFSRLQGTSGSLRTLKTYVTGNNSVTQIRPFQGSDTIIVTTPYFDSTRDALSASSMLVTASLNFDVSTGKVTSGNISIGNNIVTSATVGTIATSM